MRINTFLQVSLLVVYYYSYGLYAKNTKTCNNNLYNITNLYNFFDCNFIYNNLSNNDISCPGYAIALWNSSILPTRTMIQYEVIFTIDRKCETSFTEVDNYSWWCVNLKSIHMTLRKNQTVTKGINNHWPLPQDVAPIIGIAEAETLLTFPATMLGGIAQISNAYSQDRRINEDSKKTPMISRLLHCAINFSHCGKTSVERFDCYIKTVTDIFFNEYNGTTEYFKTNLGRTLSFQSLSILKNSNLQRLFVIDSSLGFIDSEIFKDMGPLIELRLRNCQIDYIKKGNFNYLPNLIKLDLSNNNLRKTPEGISKLKLLKVLDLSVDENNRRLRIFELGVELRELTNLKHLKLSGLNMHNLSRASLPDSKYLEILELEQCSLKFIEDDAFLGLASLNNLKLSQNELLSLNIILDQQINFLSSKYIFSMKNLDLSNNKLTSTKNLTLNKNIIINSLNLSSNAIVEINSKFNVNHLNLSHNFIPVLNKNSFTKLESIEIIDFGENRFLCQDCQIQEFQEVIQKYNSKLLWLNKSSDFLCYFPDNNIKQNVLDTEYNKKLCEGVVLNVTLISGATISIATVIFIIAGLLIFIYRFEIAYIKHLINIKRKERNKIFEKNGCRYDVFVSYCSKDRDWVWNVLLPGLENDDDNFILCLHERDFALGTYIVDNIVSCIDQSRRVICVLSTNYISSHWCKWELQMAQHRIFEDCNDFLILIELERIDREVVPLHLRILMASRTYLEWNPEVNVDSFWIRLKEALGEAIAKTQVQKEDEEEEVLTDEYYVDSNPLNLLVIKNT